MASKAARAGSEPKRRKSLRARLARRASKLKRQLWALFLALKDPDTPWLARLVALSAVAYAASPIDLIPDFIPILGQLDDLLILPALIGLAIRLIPPAVNARCRRAAWKHLASGERFSSRAGLAAGLLFGFLWLGILAFVLSRLF